MDVQTRKIAWAAPQNVLAYHTTRVGGISEEQYKSSNLSLTLFSRIIVIFSIIYE